ncbi:MAG TPA: ribonuclease III [Candidatus Sulfotelmatobacter sp.]|jgi:ribonuclease-3|nr:ribonuclease III [Candidatus Sulfotelmatobacter sp.]
MQNLPEFKNQDLFKLAFIHRSYLNESKEPIESNERLEFLGDSILSFVVSDHLYKAYPDFDEGILTNLRSLVVNTKSLAKLAKKLNFGDHLMLSHGEEDSGGRANDSILANTFEAVIGALFLDQGIDAIKTFLYKVLIPEIEEYVQKKVFKDPKSLLQEHVQARKQNSPVYKVLQEEGPAHAKQFTIGVFVGDTQLGEGQGKSKQEAEEHAAEQALEKINK